MIRFKISILLHGLWPTAQFGPDQLPGCTRMLQRYMLRATAALYSQPSWPQKDKRPEANLARRLVAYPNMLLKSLQRSCIPKSTPVGRSKTALANGCRPVSRVHALPLEVSNDVLLAGGALMAGVRLDAGVFLLSCLLSCSCVLSSSIDNLCHPLMLSSSWNLTYKPTGKLRMQNMLHIVFCLCILAH